MYLTAMQTRTDSGPPGALELIFREHSEAVYQAAYRVTGSQTDAEDVLQTVFLRLAGRAEMPDLSPSPRAYLHRAAVNAAIDLVRHRARTNAVPLDAVEIETASDRNPYSEQERRETRRMIRQAVANLGDTAAEIFVLKYFEEYTNDEIAAALGMNKMVVAVLSHRAKTRVRKDIEKFLEKKQ